MEIVLKQALEKLGKSPTDIKENKAKIMELFPVPREHEILWADVENGRRISGTVITDKGFFIKANKELVEKYNEDKNKKEKVSTIYYYIKWEFFDADDFIIKKEGDKTSICFNNSTMSYSKNTGKFFEIYNKTYQEIIKEANVAAESVFADLESVIPMNFAATNTKTGHGLMAEEALNILDKLGGKDAKVLGRNNEKNGADRIVDNIKIQTKYCSTGKGCIDSCFDKDTGVFRYFNENGSPMLIEVPRDKYAEAINTFRNKIREGKVPGVTNPDDASKYVKRGKLTYNQAKNLCKAGTIESLSYDVLTGVITCSFSLGITFLTTFIHTYHQTHDRRKAAQEAFFAGIEVFGISLFAHVLTMQVARTSITKQLIPLSTYLVQKMGYKTTQMLVNAIRTASGKTAISGAAAAKQLAKMLRSNVITSAITFVVFSVPDTYDVLQKKLSTAQYTKNILSLAGTIAGGVGGTVGATVALAKIGAATGATVGQGVGAAVGLVGGAVAGMACGITIKATGDFIREDDSIIILRLFNSVITNMAYGYMLSANECKELEETLNTIEKRKIKNLVKNIQSSKEQEKEIEDFVRNYFENIVKRRPKIAEPEPKDLIDLFESFQKVYADPPEVIYL